MRARKHNQHAFAYALHVRKAQRQYQHDKHPQPFPMHFTESEWAFLISAPPDHLT
jgi:hypothetical protein